MTRGGTSGWSCVCGGNSFVCRAGAGLKGQCLIPKTQPASNPQTSRGPAPLPAVCSPNSWENQAIPSVLGLFGCSYWGVLSRAHRKGGKKGLKAGIIQSMGHGTSSPCHGLDWDFRILMILAFSLRILVFVLFMCL